VILAGLPLWVWYFAALGVLLSVAFRIFLGRRADHESG
jgi:hypothetical protein